MGFFRHFPVGLFTKNTQQRILSEDPKAPEQVAAPAPVHRSTVADPDRPRDGGSNFRMKF